MGDFEQNHLTRVLSSDLQKKVDQSFRGQASWGDPATGKTCRECRHYALQAQPYYSKSALGGRGGLLKDGNCGKYKELMGRKGPALTWRAWACRYFDQADAPPKTHG